MFWRLKSFGLRNGQGAHRVPCFVAAVVTAILLFSGGESQACVKHNDGAAASVIVHKPVAKSMTVVRAAPVKGSERAAAECCCGQCNGNAAASGHCSACAPALIASVPTLVLENLSPIYGCQDQPALTLAKPSPDFKPPRTLA